MQPPACACPALAGALVAVLAASPARSPRASGRAGSRSARTRAASSRTAPDRAYRKAFVERRSHGMKGLQRGMGGAVIGFFDLPAEGVLRAKVIVGNDDTSSDYWENMPAS